MNIEEIVNEHTRGTIKNIFSKLDDEEIYVLLELNNQLQDKINKIDKAIEYIKDHYNLATKEEGIAFFILRDNLLEILGDKENE